MRKGDRTREMIIAQAAPLFNKLGYAGASMSAIMEATGLEKGGIYRHFGGKDELAAAAFDHNMAIVEALFAESVRKHRHAADRLTALLQVYSDVVNDPPVPGGCPLLNTAIEADDTHPLLRDRAKQALEKWRQMILRITEKGIARGELHSTVDPETVATIFMAAIEGAIMLSRLCGDNTHMERVIGHLNSYVATAVRA